MIVVHHRPRTLFSLLLLSGVALLAACARSLEGTSHAGSSRFPAGPPDGIAFLDQRAIHYSAYGWPTDARPRRAIVLVHGWASDTSVWDAQLEALAIHATVLAIDLPGHGRSDPPARDFSMDLFADAIAAVMDDAGVDSAALVGHSNGTPTVRQFYRNHPDRTEALIVVDGGLQPFFTPESAEPFLEQLRAQDYAPFVERMIDGMLSTRPDVPPERREHIKAMALATPQESMVGAMEAGIDPSIWLDDPITVPTLIVLADAPSGTTPTSGTCAPSSPTSPTTSSPASPTSS